MDLYTYAAHSVAKTSVLGVFFFRQCVLRIFGVLPDYVKL